MRVLRRASAAGRHRIAGSAMDRSCHARGMLAARCQSARLRMGRAAALSVLLVVARWPPPARAVSAIPDEGALQLPGDT